MIIYYNNDVEITSATIVVPIFNEQESLEEFSNRLFSVVKVLNVKTVEVIFVNDGSSDSSLDIARKIKLVNSDINLRILSLSRNFGHQAAILCGMEAASGDCTITIDADLQDPPEVIIEMINEYQKGFDIIFAQREKRKGEKILKTLTAYIFYKLLRFLSDSEIPRNTADFRLLSRRAQDQLLAMKDAQPYIRGMVHWIGFNQKIINYVREPRYSGETHYTWRSMKNLAKNGVIGFSTKPLKLAFGISHVLFSAAFIYSAFIVLSKIQNPEKLIPGYASITTLILWSFAFQMLILALLGEYIQYLVTQTQSRPRYILMDEF
jgi:glycosyltransferase involved in cell wall biosynthesis